MNAFAPAIGKPPLSFSSRGLAYIKALEGLSLKPYDDQTGKAITSWVAGATIGYGHLITKSDWTKYQNGLSEKQAETLLKSDLAPFIKAVKTAINVDILPHQFDALVMLAFNIGRAAFANSSVVKLINDPRAATGHMNLESAWMAWTKSQGKVMQGLVNRRKAEWNLYQRGIYP